MTSNLKRRLNKTLALTLGLALIEAPLASQQNSDYTLRVESDLVLVNVTVKDKRGNIIANLKPEDFTILEDGKAQKVISFDIENMDAVANQDVSQAKVPLDSPPAPTGAASANMASTNSQNRSEEPTSEL